ncbi:DinB family protein [Hymenobacter sp. M29]|uniref:DinB family protein n=1 Tax=Hymenobacter mellowenesis TaxID=3063995 RepID=A0ABT9AHJ4_9BACT|nr:DinB family protein [Hymenobacter sp. M29]MDO7848137.1 DinB family protein [Hymenobacter sp. M29]
MPTTSAPDALGVALLASFRHSFQQYKSLADRALAQLSDAEWLHQPAPGSNSAAVIVQHMAGNLRSRFTHFLTSDGEKPTRRRDQEFEEPATVAAIEPLRAEWKAAWRVLFELLDELQPNDLLATVTIRGEAHTVLAAVQRQVAHYAYHSGQLVQLAKNLRGDAFPSLSIPRGQSVQFNQQMAQKTAS